MTSEERIKRYRRNIAILDGRDQPLEPVKESDKRAVDAQDEAFADLYDCTTPWFGGY